MYVCGVNIFETVPIGVETSIKIQNRHEFCSVWGSGQAIMYTGQWSIYCDNIQIVPSIALEY